MKDVVNSKSENSLAPPSAKKKRTSLQIQLDVLHALILHDIKSRYLGNGLGYLITIIWPASHLAILMTIFVVSGRSAPNGSSSLLYVTTGVYPFIIWSYISRFTMMSAMQNKIYLNFPVLKPMDIVIARVILELNTSFIILVWMIGFLLLVGVDAMPINPEQAAIGVLAAVVLGVGFGMLGAVFTFLVPYSFLFYTIIIITFYPTAGIFINPESMPRAIGDLFYWNPLLHCVEMVRSAYYPDYTTRLLDIKYPFILGFATIVAGLGLERVSRRYF